MAICFISQTLLAQDTVQARVWYQQGQEFLQAGRYDSAMIYFDQEAELYQPYLEQSQDTFIWKAFLRNRVRKSICYWRLGSFDLSLELSEESLEQARKYVGDNHFIMSNIYHNIGVVHGIRRSYDKAIEAFQTAMRIRIHNFGERHTEVATCKHDIGLLHSWQGNYDLALAYYLEALDIWTDIYGNDHPRIANTNNSIGIVYQDQGAYEKALEYYSKALRINIQTFGDNHPAVAMNYHNIAVAYDTQGASDIALDYYQKALQIRLGFFGENHPDVGMNYANIGVVHVEGGDPRTGLEYFQKALDIDLKTLGESHPEIAMKYSSIGLAYKNLQEFDKALEYYDKSLQMSIEILGDRHSNVAMVHHSIGVIHELKEEYQLSQDHFQQALDIWKGAYGSQHPFVALAQLSVGNSLYHQTSYLGALEFIQASMQANVLGFKDMEPENNPDLSQGFLAWQHLLDALLQKGNTFLALAEQQNGDLNKIQLAMESYHMATQLADTLQQGFMRQEDKATLLTQTLMAYESAIQTTMHLYDLSKQDKLMDQAFAYAEKSKSALLRESWNQQQAQQYAGIPDSLLSLSKDLASQIASYEKSLFEEKSKASQADYSRLQQLQSKVFTLHTQQDQLKQRFEVEYPDYYRLSYTKEVNSVSMIQAGLDKDETLIEYFWGDSSLYAFVIQKDAFYVKSLNLESDLLQLIDQFRGGMIDAYVDPGLDEASLKRKYAQAGFDLYEILIQPIQSLLSSKLIFVPDGALGYVPFGAMLTKRHDTSLPPSSKRSYLIQEHSISYAFSATLLQEMQAKNIAPKQQLLAVAPRFDSPAYRFSRGDDRQRGYLGPLRYNQEEAQQVASYFDSQTLLDSLASKENFLQLAQDFRILHLSTHAKVNDRNADFSFLAFHDPHDSIRIGRRVQHGVSGLYLAELYNLRLNAEMVVLSACETGLGQLFRGEGIASLARGFSYAGTKSILTSLWSVNDKATTDLMSDFYRHLADGLSKDEALRQAQLTAINGNQEPFYWAGFIPMGDMNPVR